VDGGGGQIRQGKRIANESQTSEKVYLSFGLETKNPGGHSSLPVRDNAIYHLAAGSTLYRPAGRAGPPPQRHPVQGRSDVGLWPGVHVSSSALSRCVAELRQVFDDDAKNPWLIETIARRGPVLEARVDAVWMPTVAAAVEGIDRPAEALFAAWMNADGGVPLLKASRAEYAALGR
jgi:hypothetical protein